MNYVIAAVAAAGAAGLAYIKGLTTSVQSDEGITPSKVIIYGGAALALYIVLKKNKVI